MMAIARYVQYMVYCDACEARLEDAGGPWLFNSEDEFRADVAAAVLEWKECPLGHTYCADCWEHPERWACSRRCKWAPGGEDYVEYMRQAQREDPTWDTAEFTQRPTPPPVPVTLEFKA